MNQSPKYEPRVSPLWMLWFASYAERYVRRHFHSVRILNTPPPVSTQPLVIYLNHASWWDPMICLVLRNRYFAHRTSYAPIDAQALKRYPFFRKLGFFPVDQESRRGAMDFLSPASAVMSQHNAALWVTPQGRFADPRERPTELRSGISHLAMKISSATYVPLAIEYVFWQERLPEVCVNFGDPIALISAEAERLGPRILSGQFATRLEAAQDKLAHAVIRRDETALRVLSKTVSGIGGVYDGWRRLRALCKGEQFQPEHATK